MQAAFRCLGLLLFFFRPCLSNAQNVAINSDGSPPHSSAMLDVKSTIRGVLIPRLTTAEKNAIETPATGLLVFDSDAASFWFFNGAAWMELGGGSGNSSWLANGAAIYNNNAGYVGIGTQNPTSLLTLQTPINTTGFTHIGGDNQIVLQEAIGGVSAAIGTVTNHAFRINTFGAGKLHVYPGGEVVVGTNQTGSFGKLTVETTNNTYGISHLGEAGNILATRMGGTSAGIGTFSNTNMRIFSNSVSAIMIAAATGNVGIGTDNPTYKLSVNGNIRSKEVVVESDWADYVFKKNYRLPSLQKVEAFIRENGHLPGITPAAEIEKNGLNLAQMQTKMMEKIEELTLYVIDANKQLQESKKETATLRAKLSLLENKYTKTTQQKHQGSTQKSRL